MRNLKQKVLDALPSFCWETVNEIARQIRTSETAEVRAILDQLVEDGVAMCTTHPLTEREMKEKGLPFKSGTFRWVYSKL